MAKVASGEAGVLVVNLPGEKDVFMFQGPDNHFESGYQGNRRIKRQASPNSEKHMGQLLDHFGRGTQSPSRSTSAYQ